MIDIKRILDEISVLPELKQQVSSKQIMLQTVEGCTDPYFGTGYIYQFSKGGVHVQGDYKDLQKVKKLFEDSNWQEINDLDDSVCEFIDVKETDFTIPMFPELEYTNSVIEELGLYRARLINLQPARCVTRHVDQTPRLHIPLITHEQCKIVYDDEIVHFPADGKVYRIDGQRPHMAYNASLIDRYHIIGCIHE